MLQKVNRDTQKCAYKCSYALINGKGVCTKICQIIVFFVFQFVFFFGGGRVVLIGETDICYLDGKPEK